MVLTPFLILVIVLNFLCTKPKSNAPFTPRIVLLGPTGSGKSTQAELLSKKYQLINGDII